ncbi:MAG: hypoxanthine-guanine phosphoribosyltransferase [Gammaproteobacteria bacterium]|nr:hypoxanthine-guanine phosphoribosyltransferase [Gammaproteobacteria bacterium]
MHSPERIKQIFARAKCLYSSSAIEQALQGMADVIHKDLQDEDPVVLCVLIGGVVLTGKLLTLLDFPLQVDYIHATRYGDKTTGSRLEWVAKPRVSLKGRTVLIVDDILDRGVTLAGIVDYCREQGAKEIKTAVLVEKEVSRPDDAVQKADYTGVVVENRYVFGYGMDYKGYLRNAPGIFAVAPQDQ